MTIEKATVNDNEILTSLTKKSKAYWGYSEEQIDKWNNSLTVSKEYIENNFIYKISNNNEVIGYYSYFYIDDNSIKLDNLFISPENIGKGFGYYLMTDFFNRIKETDVKKVVLHSEPNAESFYQKLGFSKVGQFETSIKNRFMPIMEIEIKR